MTTASTARPTTSERILHFPTDYSLGTVWVEHADEPTPRWERLGEARWSTIIPAGMEASLWVRPESAAVGLEPLTTLPTDALRRLILLDCPVTDTDIAHIACLTELRLLDLFRTAITDHACTTIAKLGRLEWLSLTGTTIGDSGVAELRGLHELRRLSLKATLITDQSAEIVASLPRLSWLSLSGTAMSDRGLRVLSSATSLRTLSVAGTRVTNEGVARFQAARPDVALIQH